MNIYPIDGFLDAIPLPDDFADVLITSNAISWQLEDELLEVERVVKPHGQVVHLTGYTQEIEDDPIFAVMTSPNWLYQCANYGDREVQKKMYFKRVI